MKNAISSRWLYNVKQRNALSGKKNERRCSNTLNTLQAQRVHSGNIATLFGEMSSHQMINYISMRGKVILPWLRSESLLPSGVAIPPIPIHMVGSCSICIGDIEGTHGASIYGMSRHV